MGHIGILRSVTKAKSGEIKVPRKVAKALWVIAGKKKEVFDHEIWPVSGSISCGNSEK